MPLALVLVLGLALLLAGLIAATPHWRARRRNAWAARPFPPAWREVLRRRVPLYRRLPADLQRQLRRHILVFLAEKPFVGCAGLAVTDEMRVTIAAHACLLRLNRGGPLFPELQRILVYPGAFVVDRVQAAPGGVLRDERRVLAGESWSQGQVILSWQDVLDGARRVAPASRARARTGQRLRRHQRSGVLRRRHRGVLRAAASAGRTPPGAVRGAGRLLRGRPARVAPALTGSPRAGRQARRAKRCIRIL